MFRAMKIQRGAANYRVKCPTFTTLAEWHAALDKVLNRDENKTAAPLYTCQIKCLDQKVLLD